MVLLILPKNEHNALRRIDDVLSCFGDLVTFKKQPVSLFGTLKYSFILSKDTSERTKQMALILRAKVKIFFKSEDLKKMLLIKK